MKKFVIIILLLTLGSAYHISAQICGTPEPFQLGHRSDAFAPQNRTSCNPIASPVHINVYIHIMRRSNGSNAFARPNTNAIVRYLNRFYRTHKINIREAGVSFINNCNFFGVCLGLRFFFY